MSGTDEVIDIRTFGSITVVQFLNETLMEQALFDRLAGRLAELIEQEGVRQMLIDFQGVKFLSSGALAVFLEIRNRLHGDDGSLELANMRPEIEKLFRVTRLDSMMRIHPDIETAIREMGA